MEHKELIGQYIKNIRNKLGLKQNKLAESLDISCSYLSEIETGRKSPGLKVIGNLQQKFQVNPSYLFTGEGDYFLNKSEDKAVVMEPVSKGKEDDIYKASIAKLKSYLDNVSFVGFAMLVYFNQFLKENKDIIDEEIKKLKEKNPSAEIPLR